MAESVRGINVVIGADTTKLGKALEDVNKKSKDIQNELRQVERLLKFDPANTTLLAQKQQLLAQQIENTSEKLNRLKNVQQQVDEQFRRGEISEGQYRAFQREIAKTEENLRYLQSRLEETNGAINKHTTTWGRLQESLNRVGQNLRDVGQRMQNVGQSMAASFGAATAAIGGALGFAVKKSMDFEAQIDRVGAVAGATPAEIKKLEKAALDLGASTSKSATEVAQGMEIMAAMGYNTNQILAAMPGIIAAAEASGEDMALVAETVSAALNAFGLSASEASRVADVLAQAANDSAAGVQDMQYTFKYAAPIAKQLGISLEQLAAATEIMANNGIKGEQAGTTLRAALIRLSDPPREAANTLEALGVKITDANGKMLPFSNIIGQLAEKTKNMSNAQKLAALSTIFGTEAASGMLSVVEAGPQKLDALTKSLQNSAGASQEAAKKMKDNLKGSLEELQGAFETAQITIGNALAPAIEKVAGYIQKLIDWFNNLSPSTQQFIATAAAVAAVLAGVGAAIGVVLAIIGAAASGIGALTAAFGAVSGAIAAAGGALAVITGPIGLTIAAITALVAAGVALWMNWDEIKAKAIEIWGAIKEWFSVTLENIKQFFSQTWTNIKEFTATTWESIKQTATDVWNAIKEAVIGIITPFVETAKSLFDGMKSGLQTIFEGLKQYFSGVWELIKNIFLGAVLLIVDLVTGDFEGLKNDAKAIFDNLKNALQSIWEGIKLIFNGALSAIKGFVSAAWENIKSNTSIVFNTVKSTVSSIWEGIKSFFSTTVENIKTTISNGFENMKNAVFEKMTAAKQTITDIWNSTQQFLSSINLYEIGRNIIQGLIDGISSMASALWEKVKSIADSVKNALRDALDINSPSRVMRDEVGKWIPIGLAEGINRNINAVVSATNRMAQATIPNVTGYSSAGIPATTTINVPKTAGAKIENHFHFHSTAPTPSEVARKNLQVSRQLAMEWGL